MKKLERGTIKYLILLIIAVAICGMIIYPLFDFIYCKLIVKSSFSYSVTQHIIRPVIFAIAYGIIFWVVDKKKK